MGNAPTRSMWLRVVMLLAIVLAPIPAEANEEVEVAREEAGKRIDALMSDSFGHLEKVFGSVRSLVKEAGEDPARADAIFGVFSMELPADQLHALEPHAKWAKAIDPQRWLQKAVNRPDLYKKERQYKNELLQQLSWLRSLLKSREALLWHREMLSEPIQAGAGIRATEVMERRYRDALAEELITTEDHDAFRPLAVRLRWALGAIANSKSKARVKYLAIIRGENHPPYGVVTKQVIRDPVDGHIADVIWELDSLDNIPVKIGIEILVDATLTRANGTTVGRGTHTYGDTWTEVGHRQSTDPGATLRFHWNLSPDYRAVLTPAGADSTGATVTVEPKK